MNIFACFYFRAARLEREKRENKCSAKSSTFTVYCAMIWLKSPIIWGLCLNIVLIGCDIWYRAILGQVCLTSPGVTGGSKIFSKIFSKSLLKSSLNAPIIWILYWLVVTWSHTELWAGVLLYNLTSGGGTCVVSRAQYHAYYTKDLCILICRFLIVSLVFKFAILNFPT